MMDMGASIAETADEGADDAFDSARRRKRATLECTSSEYCYSVQGTPVCVNTETADFHFVDGTTGSLNTGDYTLPDGQKGNYNTGPYPTETGSASPSTAFDSAATSAVATGDDSSATQEAALTDAGSTAAEPTAASTKDTPTKTPGSSILAAETGGSSASSSTSHTSSSTRTVSSPTSAATSPTTSAQPFKGAAARYSTPSLIVLAVMGLRAMF
ncbi:MAG: hypothetical protein Q9195_007640 [Heterodermia aff. obscurata]